MSDLGAIFAYSLRYAPHFKVKTSLKFIPFRKRLHNECKPFQVEGLNPNQAIWFVEAVDRKPSDPVIVFLHGGGYVSGLNPLFMIFLTKFYKAANDEKLSILMLDYSLATSKKGKFPTQLKEAILLYKELQKSCTNISLLGDSAGGHLALNLIRHNQYASETDKVPVIEEFISPNRLILISPWLNPTLNHKDRHVDKFTHYFSIGAVNVFQRYHERPQVNYSSDNAFQQLLPSTLVIYGSNEALRGDIEEFIEVNQREKKIGVLSSKIIRRGIHDSGIVWPFGKNSVAYNCGSWFSVDHDNV
ncbi:hypothetical protein WICPIJ_004957 [Wickerhamomyces pijperi]|uniref:Alpha/beta hydrolase fold-3 domain-containing protein n=1 Tax=Wickerhamomyces pijperi TaxID=599730 RepID=A0A9P8Q6V2_WICPI|nr:hypothetical protein WICPIJ_004957 [Wickerhamomyces pijperi]